MSNGKVIKNDDGFVSATPESGGVHITVETQTSPEHVRALTLSTADARALAAQIVTLADEIEGPAPLGKGGRA